MSEFNSKLSFYIPMVFPKHANVDFVRQAFHDAQIGEVSHVVFKRNGKKYYNAYVYFNWIENEMTYGIQSELTNYKQTYFTFNNRIRNGYWIVKKNKKEDIEAKNKNILVSCYESILKDRSVEIAELKKKLREKNSAYHELFENNGKLREMLCDKELELYTANSFVDLRESMLAETETKLAETKTKLDETETKLAKSQKRLKKTKRQLENSVKEMEEHEADIEFFENKISDFKSRIEQLEAYFEEDETEHVDSDSDEREDETDEREDETEDEEQTDEDEEQADEDEQQAEQEEDEQHEDEQEEEDEQQEAEAEAEKQEAEAEETKEERIVKEDALSVILSAYEEDEDEENDFIVL